MCETEIKTSEVFKVSPNEVKLQNEDEQLNQKEEVPQIE